MLIVMRCRCSNLKGAIALDEHFVVKHTPLRKNMSEGFFGVNIIFRVEFYIEYCPYTVDPRVNLSKENRPFPCLEQFQNTRSLVFSFRLYIQSEVLEKLN